MDKGVYVLLLKNDACLIKTGALGERAYEPGWHAYVGSAFGTGGFLRVTRHIRLNIEKSKRPRWHIDSLLLSPFFQVSRAYCIHTDQKIECTIAQCITGTVIPGFGSSDCVCSGHLFYFRNDPHQDILSILHSISEKNECFNRVEIWSPVLNPDAKK